MEHLKVLTALYHLVVTQQQQIVNFLVQSSRQNTTTVFYISANHEHVHTRTLRVGKLAMSLRLSTEWF